MNSKNLWFTCVLVCLSACASLKETVIDDKMRFEGSYSCPMVSEENPSQKETVTEADVSRVRCAKDEWQIRDGKIKFTRTLYQTKACDTVLGRIQFSSPYQASAKNLELPKPKCELLRVNPSWLGEESGKCMLKDVPLNTPEALRSAYHCKQYVPSLCAKAATTLQLEGEIASASTPHDPYSQVNVKQADGSTLMSCKRYATE